MKFRDEYRAINREDFEYGLDMVRWEPEFIDMQNNDFSFYTFYTMDSKELVQRYFDTIREFIIIYYSQLDHASRHFISEAVDLQKTNNTVSLGTHSEILNKSSSVLDSYVAIAESAPTPRINTVMTSPQRDLVRKWPGFTDEEQALSRDALRRFVPRWMTHLIEPPKAEDPLDDALLHKSWMASSPEESLYLLEPDELSKGKLPLHMVFKVAKQLESDGNSDLGYLARTHALTSFLRDARTELGPRNDRLFRAVLEETLSGESLGSGGKRVRFNYRGAFEETMVSTYLRVQGDAGDEAKKSAMEFMHILKDTFDHDVLAVSINCCNSLSDQIDLRQLIQAFTEEDPIFSKEVVVELLKLKNRPLLFSAEVQEAFSSLRIDSSKGAALGGDLATATDEILADNDAYSFTISLPKLGYLVPKGSRWEVSINIEAQSGSIQAELAIERNHTIKTIPFIINFADGDRDCETQLLNDNSLPMQLRDELVHVVERSVACHIDGIHKKSRQEKVIFTARPANTIDVHEVQRQTREERIEEYERLKAGSRRKRTGSTEIAQVSSPVPDGKAIEKDREFQLRIIGLDVDTISAIMAEQKIQGIDPHLIIRKLNHVMENARVSQKMIGKRINLDTVRDLPAEINLRQLNWMMDGGNNGLRVYLEDVSGGTFILRGMLNKKGLSQQQRYIENMALQILAERRAQA